MDEMSIAKQRLTEAAQAYLQRDPRAVQMATTALAAVAAARDGTDIEDDIAPILDEMPHPQVSEFTAAVCAALETDECAEEIVSELWPGFTQWPSDQLPDGWQPFTGGGEPII